MSTAKKSATVSRNYELAPDEFARALRSLLGQSRALNCNLSNRKAGALLLSYKRAPGPGDGISSEEVSQGYAGCWKWTSENLSFTGSWVNKGAKKRKGLGWVC